MPETKPKARRFYRSNLSTIVWDSVNDRPLADFSEGHFTTSDPKLARTLVNMGYPEIPLDATEPPPDIIINQPSFAIDGDIPIIRTLQIGKGKISPGEEAKIENTMKRVIEKPGVPGIKKGAIKTEVNSSKPAEASEKKSVSGKIPRRRKKQA